MQRTKQKAIARPNSIFGTGGKKGIMSIGGFPIYTQDPGAARRCIIRKRAPVYQRGRFYERTSGGLPSLSRPMKSVVQFLNH